MADSKKELHGHCLCGQTTLHWTPTMIHLGVCHCDDCKRFSGGPYGLMYAAQRDDVKIEGPTKDYSTVLSDGRTTTRTFCGNCGSSLAIVKSAHPGRIGLAAGVFETVPGIKVFVELFSKDRLEYISAFEGAKVF